VEIMADSFPRTGERIIPEKLHSPADYVLYLEHLFSYEFSRDNLLEPTDSVLEVGCGEGYGAALLAQKVSRIIGLDIDEATLSHAAGKYASEKCSFQFYDGKKLPFRTGIFDAAVSFQVIEHVQDDRAYLAEIARVLKPQGRLLLTTPNRTYRLNPGEKPWNRFHRREYYPEELADLLKRYFPKAAIWGIQGSEAVRAIELERVRVGRKLVAFDPLHLRYLAPEKLRFAVSRGLRKLLGREAIKANPETYLTAYSTKDFYIIKENIAESLQIFVVGEK